MTNEIHWIDWKVGRPWAPPEKAVRQEVGVVHTIHLPRSLRRLAGKRYPPDWTLRHVQQFFERAFRRIAAELQPDVVVLSSSHHITGYPPRLDCPQVFDHVDYCPPAVLHHYGHRVSQIVVVSEQLLESVRAFDKPLHVIQNGVEVSRYRGKNREEAKRMLGLEGTRVVSLIGLTCSKRLYFVESIAMLQDSLNLALLIVGGGPVRSQIAEAAKAAGLKRFVNVGHVPSSDVSKYFAATDVGLYPGDDTEYYRGASPLKVVEYAAAGCQVVSSPVDMFRKGWPCVRIAPPEAQRFAQAIAEALRDPRPSPDLSRLSWDHLAEEFDKVLACARG